MIAKNIWAVEPEEYVTVCNNPEPDKTLVVALRTYEALFHPSNLCGFTQNFCFTYSYQTPKELLSNTKHSKPLGDPNQGHNLVTDQRSSRGIIR